MLERKRTPRSEQNLYFRLRIKENRSDWSQYAWKGHVQKSFVFCMVNQFAWKAISKALTQDACHPLKFGLFLQKHWLQVARFWTKMFVLWKTQSLPDSFLSVRFCINWICSLLSHQQVFYRCLGLKQNWFKNFNLCHYVYDATFKKENASTEWLIPLANALACFLIVWLLYHEVTDNKQCFVAF